MSDTFTLRIELGNDAMDDEDAVAGALREVADRIERLHGWDGVIRDVNGNTVGRYEVAEPQAREGETMTVTYGRTTYEVERNDDRENVPYTLHGPRGARYALFRNQHNPRHLFLVNGRKFTGSTPFEWVRECDDGTLEVLR